MGSDGKAAQKILVVDDEPGVRQLIGRILEMNGFGVLLAESGAQALEILKQQDGGVALVLTDIRMPGMDGAQLARRVSSLRPELPLLFITGYFEKPSPELDELGYIQKPFKPDDLVRCVRETLYSGRNPKARGGSPGNTQ